MIGNLVIRTKILILYDEIDRSILPKDYSPFETLSVLLRKKIVKRDYSHVVTTLFIQVTRVLCYTMFSSVPICHQRLYFICPLDRNCSASLTSCPILFLDPCRLAGRYDFSVYVQQKHFFFYICYIQCRYCLIYVFV